MNMKYTLYFLNTAQNTSSMSEGLALDVID